MDERPDEVRSAYERLRHGVEQDVDVERARSDFDRRRGPIGGRHRRTAWLAGAAAVVLVVGAAAGVLAWNRSDDQDVVAADDPSPTTTVADGRRCSDATIFVFMNPGATDGQIHGVYKQLTTLPGASGTTIFDQEASYQEFRRLFRDQPDLLATISAADLPASVRTEFEDVEQAAAAQRLSSEPGVLRIESGGPNLCGSSSSSPGVEGAGGTATTAPGDRPGTTTSLAAGGS
jgi:hypothetical protein